MKALLIIDVQENLMSRKIYNSGQFISTINSAIAQCRAKEYDVIFVQHNNNFLVRGDFGWQIHSGLNRSDNDPVIQKTHSNAFEENELITLCSDRNIQEIIVCGLVSHGCVKATCLGGLKKGYTVKLLANGHSGWGDRAKDKIISTEKELLKENIEIMDRIG